MIVKIFMIVIIIIIVVIMIVVIIIIMITRVELPNIPAGIGAQSTQPIFTHQLFKVC